jgi:DNA-binding IclR family transcriptional regulator
MSEARRDILRTIAMSPTPLSPKEVATHLDKNRNTTRGIMAKLVQQGALVAATADHYVLAPRYQHTLASDRGRGPEAHPDAINT